MYVIEFRSGGAWERGYLQTGMLSTVNMDTPEQPHPATASTAPCIYTVVSGSSQILRRLLPAISVCSADIPSTFAKNLTKALSAVRGHFPSTDGSDNFCYRLQLWLHRFNWVSPAVVYLVCPYSVKKRSHYGCTAFSCPRDLSVWWCPITDGLLYRKWKCYGLLLTQLSLGLLYHWFLHLEKRTLGRQFSMTICFLCFASCCSSLSCPSFSTWTLQGCRCIYALCLCFCFNVSLLALSSSLVAQFLPFWHSDNEIVIAATALETINLCNYTQLFVLIAFLSRTDVCAQSTPLTAF